MGDIKNHVILSLKFNPLINKAIFAKRAQYAPNFEEVEGAYWFGPVRLSVSPLRLLLVVKLENHLR